MTFEAGSTMLNVNAVTARLIDRGRHFHLVESKTTLPAPVSTSNLNGAPPATAILDFAGPSNISDRRDDVAFVLRPPTLPREQCGEINEVVHTEWLKGRGAAWVSGTPLLQYSKELGSFQIRVMDLTSSSPDPTAAFVTESGLAATLDTLEDAALEECTSRHLVEGGDDRLHLSETGVNKYYCPPRPLHESVIVRSSCTCSAPTPDGFESSRRLLRNLWSGHVSFPDSVENIRSRLSKVLRISVPHEVILHPSGSDAELIPLAVAMIRAEKTACSRIVNIVVAAGEVGSGSAPAAGGRHFSPFTPGGVLVKNGELATDFPETTKVIEIEPRDIDGKCFSNYDEQVMNAVREEQQTGKPFFILHAVDGSKTGLRLPSRELLVRLMLEFGNRILLVLDACQCRSEPEELNWFLQRRAIVLVTASKFFSAPGFCGAVLVPNDSVDLLKDHPLPVGLNDYLTKYEVPRAVTAVHSQLPAGPKNIGLLLRWMCGITEMEMFDALGNLSRQAIRNWVVGVRKLVCDRRPALDLIDTESILAERDNTRIGGVNSVVSIKFLAKCTSKHLNAATLKRMHRNLTIDASGLLPVYASKSEREIAAVQCMIGQPVKLGKFGVLRLAIGAPLAREIAQGRGLSTVLKEDAKILDKMVILGKYCDEMM